MSNNEEQKAPLVKEIDQACVKFLTAGQKINDIETAIRELVENSIDAQAKIIEIRLTKNGIDAIEVDDNGTGIDEANFPTLAHRYHTSKISDYQNFQDSLDSFGFRGEALSCLCSISNMTITTKTKTSPTGWKLTYKDGKLFKTERVGRSEGTTITLKNLFHSMPVRRRELEANAKKNYDKIVRILYEHVLARPYLKFSLCRKVASKKEKDFTYGGTTLEGCLINIFGFKQLDSLQPIRQADLEYGANRAAKMMKIEPDSDKSSPNSDNQCTNGNGDLSTLVTSGNQTDEVDLMSNTDSTPTSNASVYDIDSADDSCRNNGHDNSQQTSTASSDPSQSIAPSRDQIFFKRSRKSKYARERPEYFVHGYISKIGSGKNSTDCQYIFVNRKPCELPKVTKLINEIFKNYNPSTYPFYCLFIEVQRWAADFNVPRKRGIILQEEAKLCDIIRESLEKMYSESRKSCPVAKLPLSTGLPIKNGEPKLPPTQNKDDDGGPSKPETAETDPDPVELPVAQPKNQSGHQASSKNLSSSGFEFECNDVVNPIPDLFEVSAKRARTSAPPSVSKTPFKDNTSNNTGFRNGLELLAQEVTVSNGFNQREQDDISSTPDASKSRMSGLIASPPKARTPSPRKRPNQLPKPEPPCRFNQRALMQDNDLKVSIEFLEDLPELLERERRHFETPSDNKEFSFAIHPKFNSPAEEELKLNLNKTSFSSMQVVGQFNKGFIIACLNKHIFIIDQHATDERSNFESQLENYPLVKQPMVHPKPLYLNLINENAIVNNMSAFIKRGFDFIVDQSKLVGYRVMLSSTSICRGPDRDEHLGKEDVEELAQICIDSPNRLETYILTKVKSVAASIACRKSVMIGDPLTWSQMDRIVSTMSELKNPWVCAHNRPTIRHLMDADWMDS